MTVQWLPGRGKDDQSSLLLGTNTSGAEPENEALCIWDVLMPSSMASPVPKGSAQRGRGAAIRWHKSQAVAHEGEVNRARCGG